MSVLVAQSPTSPFLFLSALLAFFPDEPKGQLVSGQGRTCGLSSRTLRFQGMLNRRFSGEQGPQALLPIVSWGPGNKRSAISGQRVSATAAEKRHTEQQVEQVVP